MKTLLAIQIIHLAMYIASQAQAVIHAVGHLVK